MSLLSRIHSPADLKRLERRDLPALAEEMRKFLIDTCAQTGGHIGAGLGVVELTIVLHYVFDTPRDQLVWDVGHQGYPHKLLTGRWDRFNTLRQEDGVSGFLKRSESEYDTFGAGHAATSISAALGMAAGRDVRGEDFKVVAILGANGSGKSTLVRAVLGLVPLVAGTVRLFGADGSPRSLRRRIGYVPQRLGAGSGVPATVSEVVASGRLARRGLRPVRRMDRDAIARLFRARIRSNGCRRPMKGCGWADAARRNLRRTRFTGTR